MTAWDGSSGLLLQNNRILDGLCAGVFLDDATATLSGNSYARNGVDLVKQGSDCAMPPEGHEDEELGSTELCPSFDYATCGDEYSLFLHLSEPESGYAVTIARPGQLASQGEPSSLTRPSLLRREGI